MPQEQCRRSACESRRLSKGGHKPRHRLGDQPGVAKRPSSWHVISPTAGGVCDRMEDTNRMSSHAQGCFPEISLALRVAWV